MSILVFSSTGPVARQLTMSDGVASIDRTQADPSNPAAFAAAFPSTNPMVAFVATGCTAIRAAFAFRSPHWHARLNRFSGDPGAAAS